MPLQTVRIVSMTNVEYLTEIMEFSRFGALAQAFVIEAVARYAAEIKAMQSRGSGQSRSQRCCLDWCGRKSTPSWQRNTDPAKPTAEHFPASARIYQPPGDVMPRGQSSLKIDWR
jgi:hypothetical protein